MFFFSLLSFFLKHRNSLPTDKILGHVTAKCEPAILYRRPQCNVFFFFAKVALMSKRTFITVLTFRSPITDCTRLKSTFSLSWILIYVEALHSRTHVTAAPSASCLFTLWWFDIVFFTSSMKCFWKKKTEGVPLCNGWNTHPYLSFLVCKP